MTAGRFIVFEGGEGCGKSTQAALLAGHLGAVLTREPGGTALGAELRRILLAPPHDEGAEADPIADRTEALLMAADRAQHVEQVLRPALESGRDVVCDRYIASTVAYQGAGRGLDEVELLGISMWASGALLPDVVVLLVVPDDVAADRTGGARDRIEAAGGGFHRRVAESFLTQAEADPLRWIVVDGVGEVDDVQGRVWRALQDHPAWTTVAGRGPTDG